MKTILHTAESRGNENMGWLNTYHTFSFANYYDPNRMNFGTLRVINDDSIAAGMGFGTHPHNNMEIITIPLEGDLEHKDSMGNGTIIRHGEIQVMSAGSGITHSEFNPNGNIPTQLLQIWVLPNKSHVTPRYDQLNWEKKIKPNELLQILSPDPKDEGVWIHQNAWFNMGVFDTDTVFSYHLKEKINGLYIFVIKGNVELDKTKLKARDGLGIYDCTQVKIRCAKNSQVLLMEVPMQN